ncbi:eCIS core domain-containing protein [Nostoc sp. DSM 114159]|jgi:hypothetical protein
MTSQRIAQTNQQQKSETPQASGILQRAAVRSLADAGVQFEEQEALALSNSAFSKDFSRVPISTTQPQPIQAKLTIREPGDKYEQEADRVASQVVQQINTPSAAQSTQGKSVQRQDAAEEEIQTKPSISVLQRSPLLTQIQPEAVPEDEKLQAKSILQGRDARGAGEASTDVESAINSARGSGQALDAGLQRSMARAMGADFSGVKVHTDSQADQLNQSIQAKAFTTGQDVFFRQGEYNPGSRGGQELIAHELTHVVQQNGGAVQGQNPTVVQAYNLTQVPYETSPFSLPSRTARQGNNDFTGVNYATFWVNGNNNTQHSNQYHSEKQCWLAVASQNPALQNIKTGWEQGSFGGQQNADTVRNNMGVAINPVYTERKPCGACAPFLHNILPSDAAVYYSFDYPSTETSKFKHFDQDPDQFGVNALISMKHGWTYTDTSKAYQKQGRKEGNNDLKNAVKGIM